MKPTARIIWTPEQEALIKKGVSVPLGVILWNPQDESISMLVCEGQDLAQVRALITKYVQPDDEYFTRVQSEEDNEK